MMKIDDIVLSLYSIEARYFFDSLGIVLLSLNLRSNVEPFNRPYGDRFSNNSPS